MDKKLLKEFAMKSRESLTATVRAKLSAMHITEDINWTQSGELYQAIVGGNNIVLTVDEKSRYDKLQAAVKAEGIKAIVEKAAYTWFNRIVAIRYMELNEMLPEGKHNEWLGIRILSDSSNAPDPEILKISNLRRPDLDLPLDVDAVLKLSRDDEKFREVLLAVVKKLGGVMPDVFNGDTVSIDFLLPENLLGAGGFVSEVLKLPTSCFERVEVIGWLYQYYNQAEKDIAMKKKSAVEKDEIPFVTQIFTPDWIVRYMVENSLGRYWLEHGGDESLAKNWKYLVKSSSDTPAGAKAMPHIEDVTFIDPCAGSGHILVYAFEVFYQIYLSLGFAPAVIPEKILTHNLYGLDIDDRAKQLSILSALLVARSYDKEIFSKKPKLNITSLAESNGMSGLPELLKGESRDIAQYLIDTFRDAKEYGSILKVKPGDYAKLREQLDSLAPMDKMLYLTRTEQLIHQAEILSRKYTIAVTNPPYMNKYDAKLKVYVNANYADSKSDLATIFVEVLLNHITENGFIGMVTPDSWMFLSGHSKLRERLVNETHISSMIHLGNGAFPDVVVSTTTFTIKKGNTRASGEYIRVVTGNEKTKQTKALVAIADEREAQRYRASNTDFEVFPGKIIAYWASEAVKRAFVTGLSLEPNFVFTKVGMKTGDNARFLRLWHEVACDNFCADSSSSTDAADSGKKWFPYNKGGEFRKWYGNNDYVINWLNDGYEILNPIKGETRSFQNVQANTRFVPYVTWSKVSSGTVAFRYKPHGHLYDMAGASMFADDVSLKYLQGVLNSKIIELISSYVSPTLNFEPGQIGSYPIIQSTKYRDEVIKLVEENRDISKAEWDSFELSWDFERHPLLPSSDETKLSDSFEAWNKVSETRWNNLKANEERLNEIFIEVYGMGGELTPTVEDKYVSVRKADMTREAKCHCCRISSASCLDVIAWINLALTLPVVNGMQLASHRSLTQTTSCPLWTANFIPTTS